jgi:hypothetical protein
VFGIQLSESIGAEIFSGLINLTSTSVLAERTLGSLGQDTDQKLIPGPLASIVGCNQGLTLLNEFIIE